MKNNIKKMVFGLFALSVVLLFLIGCSEDEDGTGEITGEVVADQPEEQVEEVVSEPEGEIEGDVGEELDEEEEESEETEELEEELEKGLEDDTEVVLDGSTTHTVNLIDGGFELSKINIEVGDTVVWQNVRDGKIKKAMVIGATNNCRRLKSKVFLPGDMYSWTFEKVGTCTVVGGIYTTQAMKVIIE